ncbi:MAG: SpoIIIAH-like family protein [Candidatus Limivivens sp.]|nr:SpoIIIAH-like family protein [Candidatus Limivivens sp.]
MKHIFKKNQIVITALAVMIAVAGYLNYSGTRFGEDGKEEASATVGEESGLLDIESLDDPEEGISAEGTLTVNDTVDLTAEAGSQSAELQDLSEDDISGTPGEAVLTSMSAGSGFAAEAKLTREQVRAQNKETLLEVINNENITEEQKQNAVDNMTELTEIAEREAAAELLLESKGFQDSVVSITDGTVDVVICQSEISEAERAQIEDIVKRKTGVSGSSIVISPMSVND